MCAVDPLSIPRDHAPGAERPSPTLDRMLNLAHAGLGDAISVTGPASLPAMIGLCRKGYERVECARQATCGGADGASDILIVSGPCGGAALSDALGRTARLLRDGGVIVVHEGGLDDDLVLVRRLEELGFEVEWTVHDLAEACLAAVRARRVRPQLRAAA